MVVADYGNNRLMKFGDEGEGVQGIVVRFSDLISPVDVKINNNGIFVLDLNRIY